MWQCVATWVGNRWRQCLRHHLCRPLVPRPLCIGDGTPSCPTRHPHCVQGLLIDAEMVAAKPDPSYVISGVWVCHTCAASQSVGAPSWLSALGCAAPPLPLGLLGWRALRAQLAPACCLQDTRPRSVPGSFSLHWGSQSPASARMHGPLQ